MGTNNKIKLVALTIVMIVQISFIHAQQDPLFSKYMFNPLFVNPAYAGSRETVSSVLIYRVQWVGFDGAPTTQTFSTHSPLAKKKMGVGVSVIRDQIGPSVTHGILGAYAYRLKMLDGKLSLALRAAMYNYSFNWDEIDFKENESALLAGRSNYWVPSFDFGARFHNRNLYAGLTLSHLNQPSINTSSTADTANNQHKLIPHAILIGGYAYKVRHGLVLKPSFLINTSQSLVTTADINFSALFDQVLWIGASYRTSKTIVTMVQYDINEHISAGYSYDITLGKLRNYNSGSHEIFFRYEFHFRKSKVLSPRYF